LFRVKKNTYKTEREKSMKKPSKKTSTFRSVISYLFVSVITFACQKQDLTGTAPAVSAEFTDIPTATAAAATSATIRIEAENYSKMQGVLTEAASEGGKNVGGIQAGEWMDYSVNVASAGSYKVNFRVAGPGGQLQLRNAAGTVLATVTAPKTASWQAYTTVSANATLAAGQQTLRVYAVSAGFNLNWFELVGGTAGTTTPTPTTPVTPPASTQTPVPAPAPGTSTGANLLFANTFEDASSFNYWGKEICRPDAVTLSTTVARKGKSSVRFEFAKTDVTNYNGYIRAELKQNFAEDKIGERWYGFSNFLPSDFVTDPLAEVIAQWHEIPDWDLGENWRSPPISLMIENGRYKVKVMWAAAAVNTNQTKDGEIYYDLGPVDKNVWNDWAFHIKFSHTSTGVLEVWKNKQKVLTRNGPNSFNDKNFPYFKIGIYKWTWNGSASQSPESKRVLFYDEVKVGTNKSNLAEVSPQ
jgi:hypothetical protein